jgi:rhodanese-related sulfurtransferase
MTRLLAAAAVATVALAAFPVLACDKEATKVTVAELSSLKKAKAAVAVLDANDRETRAKMGIIPGAILLTGFEDYSLSQLPKNKSTKLVFYCANTMCSASEAAAQRATAAGYTDVATLPVGIKGWAEAGMPVDHLGKS